MATGAPCRSEQRRPSDLANENELPNEGRTSPWTKDSVELARRRAALSLSCRR